MTIEAGGIGVGAPLPSSARVVTAKEPASAGGAMTRWLAVVLGVVIVAGGLFGYDQGVISGALPGIKQTFSLSLLMVQVVTSWVTLGALAGSLAGGALSDHIGRRRAMLLSGASTRSDPFETAARELGAPYSIGEVYAFEAFRTGMYARRLPITMIFGIDRTVAEGLGDEFAAVVARVPVIVARPDAAGLLAGAGAKPFIVTRVGRPSRWSARTAPAPTSTARSGP